MRDGTRPTDGHSDEDGKSTDGNGGPEMQSRRSMLSGMAGLTTASIAGNPVQGSSWFWEDDAVPTPTVEGPVTGGEQTGEPQMSSVIDLEPHGYVEEEYFISGEARPIDEFTGGWFTSPESYKTRVLVWRPADEAEFNGSVVIDWPNVTLQLDVPTIWINTHRHLLREGYAVAMVSTQWTGVEGSALGMDLKSWDPTRYGSLSHPGDRFCYDIASQAAQALRTGDTDPDLLGGLRPEHIHMGGLSLPSYFLQTYINEVQAEAEVIDGFLPVGGAVEPIGVDDDVAHVMWVNTEDEVKYAVPTTDSGQVRYWEVTGAAHVNHWLAAYSAVAQERDYGGSVLDSNMPTDEFDPAFAGQYGQDADATYGDCYGDYFPMRYAYHSALDHLNSWVSDGDAPPTAPPIERDGLVGAVTDEYGNAIGGVRLPPVDVPLAHYDATANCQFLGLSGETHRFDNGTLEALYPTREDYLSELDAAIQEAVDDGFLLAADATDLRQRAQNVDIRN